MLRALKGDESYKRRRKSILAEAKRRGFNTVVFINEIIGQNPANFLYVSGSWGYGQEHSALIFDVNGGSTAVVHNWLAPRMKEMGLYDNVVSVQQEKGHHAKGIKEALERYHDAKLVCFDFSTMSAQFAFQLMGTLGIELGKVLDISDYIFRLRTVKDEYEIEEIKKAIMITEEAVVEFASNARPGASIAELKRKMDASMIEKGAIEFSFGSDAVFCRGPYVSDEIFFRGPPPRVPDIIKHGDMLYLDVGCRVASGYCSDMGRTFPVNVDSDVKDFLNRAVAAHKETIKLIRDGVIASKVLEGANEINAEYGFNPIPRCGHQIGLEVHDYTMPFAPNFGSIEEDNQPLKEGMTLTFEPFHVDPKKNMRTHIEDIVLVKKNGSVILNELPWDLLW